MVDFDFHAVHALLDLLDGFDGLDAEVRKRIDGLADLRLDEAAEFHHARGNAVEFAVELRGEVFVCHVVFSLDVFNRNGR